MKEKYQVRSDQLFFLQPLYLNPLYKCQEFPSLARNSLQSFLPSGENLGAKVIPGKFQLLLGCLFQYQANKLLAYF